MWDAADERNYAMETANGSGQIHDDEFATDIRRYAADPRFETYLEIGTWNGLGSTRAFADGFSARTKKYVFYSLECNADKCADAQKLYERDANMHVLNEVLWNEEPADFYEVFPQCRTNPTARRWHEIDMINMKACPLFLERPGGVPEIFDVVLLDGGEFTTYHEFQALKDRCRILMLDDVNSDKCRLIRDELCSNPDRWTVLKTNAVRNGYLIAERKKNMM